MSAHCSAVQYRNPWGAVRIGKLLEDLDALAGSVAYNHCDPGPGFRLPMLVTAAVDAIQINHRLNLDNDLEMSGQVAWTGSSSMDIRMELRQVNSFSLLLGLPVLTASRCQKSWLARSPGLTAGRTGSPGCASRDTASDLSHCFLGWQYRDRLSVLRPSSVQPQKARK